MQLPLGSVAGESTLPDAHIYVPEKCTMQTSKLTLASLHYVSGLHQTANAKLCRTHFSATRTSALKRF